MRKTAILFLTVLFTFPCYSAVITVDDDGPADFNNIQAAIDSALPGDVVEVQDGIYTGDGNRDITFHTNAITLRSINGPANCIIDCQATVYDEHRAFIISGRTATGTVLDGFTITGGHSNTGGAIRCEGVSPKIRNCIIKNNLSSEGGGIFCSAADAVIINCIIAGNDSYRGGGIYCDSSDPKIFNCTIVGNTGHDGSGGIYADYRSSILVENSIIRDGIYLQEAPAGGGTAYVTYSNIKDGWAGVGNIDAEPEFVDPAGGDYHLTVDSACVNAGDAAYPVDPCETDIDGQMRIINGIIDMGADELDAEGPVMGVQPRLMGFRCYEPGDDPQNHHHPKKIYITNRSPQILSWQITEDCNWLDVIPSTGQTTTETDVVTLSFDTSALSYGVYSCELVVNGDGAINEPVIVTVYLAIGAARYVPSGLYPTIQSAINAAVDGDTVIVEPGTYTGPGNYDIDFLGKRITVSSINPNDADVVAATVVIHDTDVDIPNTSVFDFQAGEDANSVLTGFTIMRKGSSHRPVVVCDESSPRIANCVITSEPGSGGSGMRLYNSNAKIVNCTITGFSTPCPTRGVAIACESDYDPFSYPYVESFGPEIINCRIVNNRGGRSVGIIYLRKCKCEITGTLIADNKTPASGGGLRCWESRVIIKNSTIRGNSSSECGGGIHAYKSELELFGSVVSGNSASLGGGLYCDERCKVRLKNSTISGNSAEYGGGAYLYYENSRLELHNCTMAGNSAEQRGGALYCYGGRVLLMTNCILWDNTSSLGLEHFRVYYSNPQVSFSCIQDDDPNDENIPYGGQANGNIDDDPGFVGWPDDLHLGIDSVCINAGSPYMITGPNDVDIDGQMRIIGGRVDMGADEYAPMITVTKPAGGEVWAAGSSHEIQWESLGVDDIDILFSDDGGQSYETIAADIDASAAGYMWELPHNCDSNQCIISVEPAVEDSSVIVIESDLFEINKLSNRPAIPPGQPDRNRQRRTGLSENIGPELGCIKWSFATEGPVTAPVALGHNNRVYVPCEDGKLYALNNSGELIWSYDVNSPILSTPVIDARGTLYVGADDGKLYAISHNGELLWSFATGSFIYGSAAVGPDGDIYVGSTDGLLYALGPDGSELWKFETAGFDLLGNSILASPMLADDGTVCIAGFYDPNLYALDANDGSVKWVRTLIHPEPVCKWDGTVLDMTDKSGWPFASSVMTDDGVIYQTALYDPNLYAIDANDGGIIWTSKMKPQCSFLDEFTCGTIDCSLLTELCGSDWYGVPLTEWYGCQTSGSGYRGTKRPSNCWSRPALGPDGTIYVSFDDPYLRAVDPNGSIKWVRKIGTVGGFTLTVGPNGLIYAAGDDGNMYVLNSNGDELSRFESDQWLSFPAITVANTVIVSDSNDTVWAIGGGDCSGGLSELHRPSDLTADGIVNMFDFTRLANNWPKNNDEKAGPMRKGAYPEGDVNADGVVDANDLFQLAENWLKQE